MPAILSLPVVRVNIHAMADDAVLTRIRDICLGLPETSERLSHGHPTFFIRAKKTFVMYLDDHHGDGRLAIWCAAPAGMQHALVEGDPDHYFSPPYVGRFMPQGALQFPLGQHKLRRPRQPHTRPQNAGCGKRRPCRRNPQNRN